MNPSEFDPSPYLAALADAGYRRVLHDPHQEFGYVQGFAVDQGHRRHAVKVRLNVPQVASPQAVAQAFNAWRDL